MVSQHCELAMSCLGSGFSVDTGLQGLHCLHVLKKNVNVHILDAVT